MSSNALVPQPPSLSQRRLKRVSEESLMSIFQSTIGSGTRSHGSQTDLLSSSIDIHEQLLSLRSLGVITQSHARDRIMLLRILRRSHTDILAEERWQREQISKIQSASNFALWSAFVKTLPVFSAQSKHPIKSSHDAHLNSVQKAQLEAQIPAPGPSVDSYDILKENEKLRSRVCQLEQRLATKLLVRTLPSPSASNRSATVIFSQEHQLTTSRKSLASLVVSFECDAREALKELQRSEFKLISAESESSTLSIKLRYSARELVHVPYTGHRPKVPVAHAGNSEDYFRKWLLAETFQHYEDCGILLQTLENETRNALEEQQRLLFEPMFSVLLVPLLKKVNLELRSELERISDELNNYKMSVALGTSRERIATLLQSEEHSRQMLLDFAENEYADMMAYLGSPATIDSLQNHLRKLKRELHRQQCRNRFETETLKSLLPHDGIRPASSPFHPHCEVSSGLMTAATL